MQPVERHPFADASFDGGDLDCGNGLLLLIRQYMDPLERGQRLEFRSTEISVDEDFPAWCRMTGNELVSFVRRGRKLLTPELRLCHIRRQRGDRTGRGTGKAARPGGACECGASRMTTWYVRKGQAVRLPMVHEQPD